MKAALMAALVFFLFSNTSGQSFAHQQPNSVEKDFLEAKAKAEMGDAEAACSVGVRYQRGYGTAENAAEAVRWYRRSGDQGYAKAQYYLGRCYEEGHGVPKDPAEAAKWYRKAAEQGLGDAQSCLAVCYWKGDGVRKDRVEAYKWGNLALSQGRAGSKQFLYEIEKLMTPQEIGEGQRLAREFRPRQAPDLRSTVSEDDLANSRPAASGSGFFITEDGFLVTSAHVVKDAGQLRLRTASGVVSAKVVRVDLANDLALLFAEGHFAALPTITSRSVQLGATVFTVGFPNITVQGFAPKMAKGEIAGLSGAQDDPRYFQISLPIQPGNSGGALLDERGSVVGVVAAKLSLAAAVATSGALPENVNYAVKSSFLLSFLESVPDVLAKRKEPTTAKCEFQEVVRSAERATVLVLVY